MFASESKMMDWILDRNGNKDVKIEAVPVDTVVSISLKNNSRTNTEATFRTEYTSPQSGTQQTTNSNSRSTTAGTESAAKSPKGVPVKHEELVNFNLLMIEEKTVNGETRHHLLGKDDLGVRYRAWLPSGTKEAELQSLVAAKKLTALAGTAVYKNGNLLNVWVTNVRAYTPPKNSRIRTFNGVQMSSMEEWRSVVAEQHCRGCGGFLDERFPKYTAVTMEKNGTDVKSVVCPACLADKFSKWTTSEQDWILNNNGYDPREYFEERAALAELGNSTVH